MQHWCRALGARCAENSSYNNADVACFTKIFLYRDNSFYFFVNIVK